jgi:hypothetical protein
LKNDARLPRQVLSIKAVASTEKAFSKTKFPIDSKNPDYAGFLFKEMPNWRSEKCAISKSRQRSGPKASPTHRQRVFG